MNKKTTSEMNEVWSGVKNDFFKVGSCPDANAETIISNGVKETSFLSLVQMLT